MLKGPIISYRECSTVRPHQPAGAAGHCHTFNPNAMPSAVLGPSMRPLTHVAT